jgi:hypothetical protein
MKGLSMKRVFFIGVVAAFLSASQSNAQSNLSADTLMGRWCGDISAYTFTPDKLVVTFFDGRPQSILRIKTINVDNGTITVIWDPRDGDSTDFNEFSGGSMV